MAVKTWTGGDDSWHPKSEEFTVEYEGHVVGLREMNGYDDSDFYAVVWDAEAAAPKEVMYATTRGWTYNNSASVDATPEVMEAYNAYQEAARVTYLRYRAEQEASVPSKGKRVTVVKGRKVPVGTTGTVIWHGEGNYGWRVGVKDADGEVHWTAASNVQVEQEVSV